MVRKKPNFKNVVEEAAFFITAIQNEKLTHQQCAINYKIERSRLTNLINLYKLPSVIRHDIAENKISYSQARELVKVSAVLSTTQLISLGKKVVIEKTPVSRLSRMIQEIKRKTKSGDNLYIKNMGQIDYMERQLTEHLHTRTKITGNGKKGEFVISYFNEDEMSRIWDLIRPKRGN